MTQQCQKKINNAYILSFSMSNYLLYGGGTNLVVSNHQKLYNANGISYVCVAPFLLHGKKYNKLNDYWSLIIDGEQRGVLRTSNLIQALEMINSEGAQLIAVHIHHWKDTNLDCFQQIVDTLDTIVYMFVHDYFTVCCNFTLLRQDTFCGCGQLSDDKCSGCLYYSESLEKRVEYEKIWDKLKNRLYFIFPSEVSQKVWTAAYPQYKHLCNVIPHQHCIGSYDGNMGKTKEKLNVAFVGSREKYKGWEVFIELYSREKKNPYFRWFYFGTDEIGIGNINHIYVDNRTDPMAMMKALRSNNIDVAVLWSLCKETYSYTYFECYAANVFVLTNANSGNIAFQVSNHRNGLVVESDKELFDLFSEKIIKQVNLFKTGRIRGPKFLSTNKKILDCCTSCKQNKKVKLRTNRCGFGEYGLFLLEKLIIELRKLRK